MDVVDGLRREWAAVTAAGGEQRVVETVEVLDAQ